MISIADELRDQDRSRVLAIAPSERVELAHRLGDEAAAIYSSANGLSREEAIERLRGHRQCGRLPCSFLPCGEP